MTPPKDEAPFFPPPPKADSPFRAAAPRAPGEPPARPRRQVVVSRPEPPSAPVEPSARVQAPLSGGDPLASPRANTWLRTLERWPRPTALAVLLACSGAFFWAMCSLADRPSFFGRSTYAQLYVITVVAAGAAWVAAWGLPYDHERGRWPTWFVMGLLVFAIGAAAVTHDLAGVLKPLFSRIGA